MTAARITDALAPARAAYHITRRAEMAAASRGDALSNRKRPKSAPARMLTFSPEIARMWYEGGMTGSYERVSAGVAPGLRPVAFSMAPAGSSNRSTAPRFAPGMR